MQTINDYPFEDANLIVESAIQERNEKIKYESNKLAFFKMRSNIIQNYFIRLSSPDALNFLLQLTEQINSVPLIYQLLQVMFIGKTKMIVYTITEASDEFIFDKLFTGHNRMLDRKVLSTTIDNDVKWFAKLDDVMQMSLLLDLIKIGGGGLRKNLYMPFTAILSNKLRRYRKLKMFHMAPISTVELLEYPEDMKVYDPNHSSSVEVEKQRKRWNDVMAQYECEINSTARDLMAEYIPQTEEQKKQEKNFKKAKDQVFLNEMDMVQLLSVGLVKKILNYLNLDDLKIAGKVNAYWTYIVNDILKERKSRENINKYLAQLKEKIDPVKLQNAIEEFDKKKSVKLLQKKSLDVVTISKKLVPKRASQLVETSLISDVLKFPEHEFSLTGELLAFPRMVTDDMRIYRRNPCFLQDTNVQLEIDEDIKHQQSLLSYSLSTIRSTVGLTLVDKLSLESW